MIGRIKRQRRVVRRLNNLVIVALRSCVMRRLNDIVIVAVLRSCHRRYVAPVMLEGVDKVITPDAREPQMLRMMSR